MSIPRKWSIGRGLLGSPSYSLKDSRRLTLQKRVILSCIILIHWYVLFIEIVISLCQYTVSLASVALDLFNGPLFIEKE